MRKTILLTFDDAVVSQCENVAPLLNEYRFGATFFICRFNDDWRKKNEKHLMTGRQIKTLDEMGFEIANHTWNHPDLRTLSEPEIETEIDRLNGFLAENGIAKPVSFAYPGGPFAENAVGVLKRKGFLCARSVRNAPFDPEADDPMNLPAVAVQGEDPSLFRNAIAMADEKKPVVLVFHGVPEYVHPWVNQEFPLFREYMLSFCFLYCNIPCMKNKTR